MFSFKKSKPKESNNAKPLEKKSLGVGFIGGGAGEQSKDFESCSAISACLRAITRTFPEAPLRLMKGDGQILGEHPFLQLLSKPNPNYSGSLLWQATISSLVLDGNAYWYLAKNAQGRVVEIWYLPHFAVKVKASKEGTVESYEYKAGNVVQKFNPADVIHFRDNLDTRNPLKGISYLKSAMLEICADKEISIYSFTILRNLGIPGIIVSPKGDISIDEESASILNLKLNDLFSGDKRGKSAVLTEGMDFFIPNISPDNLDLSGLRQFTERRICSAIGVPISIAGLGEDQTYNNYNTQRQVFYENCILPLQKNLAEHIQPLLSSFDAALRVFFDTSGIAVLQDDVNALHERVRQDWTAGLLTRAEARAIYGLESTAEDDIYYTQVFLSDMPESESKRLLRERVRNK